ncbi:MAG: ATP-binding protein [Oleispira sp.]
MNKLLSKRINHKKWRDSLIESFTLICMSSPGDVISITGPSRVGKTSLINELIKKLGYDDDHETITSISVTAANSGPYGTFSTKSFTISMLEAAHYPFIPSTLEENSQIKTINPDRLTEHNLRLKLERFLKQRRTRFIFIDEAQHAQYAPKAQGSHAVLDSWKCLAQTTNTILIIVGAYPVLNIFKNSPHLLGRKRQVHLGRYQANPEDLLEFAAIVHEYSLELNLSEELKPLEKYTMTLYEGSFGCIGLLRNWLIGASAKAIAHEVRIDKNILMQCRFSDSDLEVIYHEIQTGEDLLRSESPSFKTSAPDTTKEANKSIKEPRKQTKSKPFQKKPRRLAKGNRTSIK